MEKIRDLDECVETEKARATSLREVRLYFEDLYHIGSMYAYQYSIQFKVNLLW